MRERDNEPGRLKQAGDSHAASDNDIAIVEQKIDNEGKTNLIVPFVAGKDNKKERIYSSNEVPELLAFANIEELRKVLGAILELRRQFHIRPIALKIPFPGLRARQKGDEGTRRDLNLPGPAYNFAREQYGKEMDEGILSPGDIKKIDSRLYLALGEEARSRGIAVADYLGIITKEELRDRRRLACSELFETPLDKLDDVSSFFVSVRDQRGLPLSRRQN